MVLQKIDELTEGDHHHITPSDDCYYFAEYPSGDASINKNNPIYSLIHNLKKRMDKVGAPGWRYKQVAIDQCSEKLIELFTAKGNVSNFTLVPIPPSKTKENVLYDDRMTRILEGAKLRLDGCDVRELIFCQEDREPTHHTNHNRPSIDDIFNNYRIDEGLTEGVRERIILFDDVLTNGTHFCAARRIILERFPNSQVLGFFIARRVFPDPVEEFDFSDWI